MGPNQFSDLTLEEFQALPIRGFKKMANSGLPKVGSHVHSGKPAVDSIDWSTKGAVTPVKNQGQCGSCWSFSSTGGLEGQWEIATGTLQSISEQQLVDCSKNGGNAGCNGGLMDNSFEWYESKAAATEASYPYTARDGSCKSSFETAVPQGGVTGYKDVSSESALLDAVTNVGPVSVAIEADQSSFQGYSGGVLTGNCGTQLDHGVLAVGFGTSGGTDYWKVKNSWGASWGMNGYVLIERGVNKCGIASEPSYPTVSASLASASPYQQAWEEFQAVQGPRNGDIPQVFKDNVDAVNAHNAGESSFKLSYTGPFADKTHDEYKQVLGYKPRSLYGDLPKVGEHVHSGKPAVSSIDWTTKD